MKIARDFRRFAHTGNLYGPAEKHSLVTKNENF